MIYERNKPYVVPEGTRPTKIVAAAILQNGKVWIGRRHAEIIPQLIEDSGEYVTHQQGFWTDDNRFVTRTVARAIAISAGQIEMEASNTTLLSEYLW